MDPTTTCALQSFNTRPNDGVLVVRGFLWNRHLEFVSKNPDGTLTRVGKDGNPEHLGIVDRICRHFRILGFGASQVVDFLATKPGDENVRKAARILKDKLIGRLGKEHKIVKALDTIGIPTQSPEEHQHINQGPPPNPLTEETLQKLLKAGDQNAFLNLVQQNPWSEERQQQFLHIILEAPETRDFDENKAKEVIRLFFQIHPNMLEVPIKDGNPIGMYLSSTIRSACSAEFARALILPEEGKESFEIYLGVVNIFQRTTYDLEKIRTKIHNLLNKLKCSKQAITDALQKFDKLFPGTPQVHFRKLLDQDKLLPGKDKHNTTTPTRESVLEAFYHNDVDTFSEILQQPWTDELKKEFLATVLQTEVTSATTILFLQKFPEILKIPIQGDFPIGGFLWPSELQECSDLFAAHIAPNNPQLKAILTDLFSKSRNIEDVRHGLNQEFNRNAPILDNFDKLFPMTRQARFLSLVRQATVNLTSGNKTYITTQINKYSRERRDDPSTISKDFTAWVTRCVRSGHFNAAQAQFLKNACAEIFGAATIEAPQPTNKKAELIRRATQQGVVGFYNEKDPVTEFLGNFFEEFPFTYDNVQYKTAEGAFQAQKAPREKRGEYSDLTGNQAWHKRQAYKIDPREWDAKKEEIMEGIVFAKFSQHQELKELLLATGKSLLVEHNECIDRDKYWSDNFNGSGANMLGIILMRVRKRLGGTGVVQNEDAYNRYVKGR